MNTHDIELPQGYRDRPWDYDGDLYTEGQVRAAIEADRKQRGEPVAWRWLYNGKPDSETCYPLPLPGAVVRERASAAAFPRTVQVLYASPQPDEPVKVPSDKELIAWAGEEQLFLFCDEDDFLQIAREVLARYGAAQAQPVVNQQMTTEREAFRRLLEYAESQICMHEETHRGGAIWEICDQCGAKWADDEGGKPEFAWPKEIADARAALAQQPVGQDREDA